MEIGRLGRYSPDMSSQTQKIGLWFKEFFPCSIHKLSFLIASTFFRGFFSLWIFGQSSVWGNASLSRFDKKVLLWFSLCMYIRGSSHLWKNSAVFFFLFPFGQGRCAIIEVVKSLLIWSGRQGFFGQGYGVCFLGESKACLLGWVVLSLHFSFERGGRGPPFA